MPHAEELVGICGEVFVVYRYCFGLIPLVVPRYEISPWCVCQLRRQDCEEMVCCGVDS